MPIIKPPSNKVTGEPSWRWRRIVALWSIVYCQAILVYMIDNPDTALNAAIAQGVLWLMFALVTIYTGFATIQDLTAIWVTRSGRPYADQVQSVDPAPPTQNVTVASTAIVPGGQVVQQTDPNNPPPGYGT